MILLEETLFKRESPILLEIYNEDNSSNHSSAVVWIVPLTMIAIPTNFGRTYPKDFCVEESHFWLQSIARKTIPKEEGSSRAARKKKISQTINKSSVHKLPKRNIMETGCS